LEQIGQLASYMNSEADNLYFDYVVKRYQAFPNMVFYFEEALLMDVPMINIFRKN
jgi:hypothetical protein